MGDPAEKARRKQLRDSYKNAERAARTSLIPLDEEQLEAPGAFVEEQLAAEGCDHTLRQPSSAGTATARSS